LSSVNSEFHLKNECSTQQVITQYKLCYSSRTRTEQSGQA